MTDPCTPQPPTSTGSARLEDGTRVHLTEKECAAIWAASEAQKAKRAADMQTEQEAINVLFEAFTRLKELGWREAQYCPKDGTPFSAIEVGSTGIHPGFYSGEWPTGYFMIGEGEWCGPLHPILIKLSDEDEKKRRDHMANLTARFYAEMSGGDLV